MTHQLNQRLLAEVAAIHVACRLGELSMVFDNPLTGEREVWRHGRFRLCVDLHGARAEYQPIFGTWNPPLYTPTNFP